MQVFFDNYCPLCIRTVFIISKLDWFGLIDLKLMREHLETNDYPKMDKEKALTQIASFTDRWRYGFSSVFEIIKRIPLFWLFIPLFWGLKVSGLGQYLYIHLSVKRSIIPINCNNKCELPQ